MFSELKRNIYSVSDANKKYVVENLSLSCVRKEWKCMGVRYVVKSVEGHWLDNLCRNINFYLKFLNHIQKRACLTLNKAIGKCLV